MAGVKEQSHHGADTRCAGLSHAAEEVAMAMVAGIGSTLGCTGFASSEMIVR